MSYYTKDYLQDMKRCAALQGYQFEVPRYYAPHTAFCKNADPLATGYANNGVSFLNWEPHRLPYYPYTSGMNCDSWHLNRCHRQHQRRADLQS